MGSIRIKQALAENVGSIIFSGTGNSLTENNSNLFWNNSSLRLGIRTSSPNASLQVHGNSSSSTNYSLIVHNSTGTSNSFVVEDDGYVGIGTLPNYKLHILYDANNYVYYNPVGGEPFTIYSSTASITGFRANRNGTILTMVAGSSGNAYININGSPGRFDFYANNTSVLAGAYSQAGEWGFGSTPTSGTKLKIIGAGTTLSTYSLQVHNSTGTSSSLLVRDDGNIGIGITPSTGAKLYVLSASGQGFGTVIASNNTSPAEAILEVRDYTNVSRLRVSATGVTNIGPILRVGNNAGGAGTLSVRGSGTTSATVNFRFEASDTTRIIEAYDDGHIGINVAPSATDRLYISSGTGKNGALNILASGLNDNGYGIFVQGSGSSTNAYGIWSDITGGTSNGWAFRGSSHSTGVSNNYGGYFSARNGTTSSIGAYCIVTGSDSVNSTNSSAVYATNESVTSTDKKGVWSIITGSISNGIAYGVNSEVNGDGTNAINYGYRARVNGSGATITNYGGWFQADGGSGATNYAIIVPSSGGNVGIGTSTPSDTLHLVGTFKFVDGNQAAGKVLESDANGVGTWTTPSITASSTTTVTNKRITKRVVSVTPSATPVFNTDNGDIARLVGLSTNITNASTNLTGTPNHGDMFSYEITDDGTARTISWGSSFISTTLALPTTTVISTLLRCLFQWNSATSKWEIIAVI